MNRIVFSNDNQIDQKIFEVIEPEILSHLERILGDGKTSSRDLVKATLLGEGIGKARLIEKSKSRALFKMDQLSKPQEPWFNLVIGLSRPPTIKKILEHASAFGAHSMHFFKAELSEKSYLQSKIWDKENLNKTLKLGLSQSGYYAHFPEVTLHSKLQKSLIEDLSHKYLLDLKSKQWMKDLPTLPQSQKITFVIGPERGWTERERETLIGLGCIPIKVSNSILRTEMATFSILSQAELLRS